MWVHLSLAQEGGRGGGLLLLSWKGDGFFFLYSEMFAEDSGWRRKGETLKEKPQKVMLESCLMELTRQLDFLLHQHCQILVFDVFVGVEIVKIQIFMSTWLFVSSTWLFVFCQQTICQVNFEFHQNYFFLVKRHRSPPPHPSLTTIPTLIDSINIWFRKLNQRLKC